jgi:hypothetical protein
MVSLKGAQVERDLLLTFVHRYVGVPFKLLPA